MVPQQSRADISNQVVLRARGQVTIPAEIRDALGLKEGDRLIVTVQKNTVVLVPVSSIPRDQLWYWTPEFQAGELEIETEGPGPVFLSEEEFDAYLAAIPAAD